MCLLFSDPPQHHRENRFPKMLRHRIEHHAKLDKQVRTFELEFLGGYGNLVMHCFLILKAPFVNQVILKPLNGKLV